MGEGGAVGARVVTNKVDACMCRNYVLSIPTTRSRRLLPTTKVIGVGYEFAHQTFARLTASAEGK